MIVEPTAAYNAAAQASSKQDAAKQAEFEKALRELDEYLESQKKTESQKSRERQAEYDKRAKAKRVEELKARISSLRSRINMGYEKDDGELDSLKNQLFLMLLFG